MSMPGDFSLSWSEPGSKIYERGVDRGVLYFQNGAVVVWDGLTAVDEQIGLSSEPVYFDGMKLSEIPNDESFSLKVSAITYPDQLEEVYGNRPIRLGVHLGEQAQQIFSFCYRNKIGTDLDEDRGYKIHLVYNVTAIPDDIAYATISDDPGLTEFGWEFTTTPEYVDGYKPSAHIVIDTSETSSHILTALENILYGSETTPPYLPSLSQLVNLINDFANVITVVDNGDGTWTATSPFEGYIIDLGDEEYEIREANIEWNSSNSYLISSTTDIPPP